METRLRVRLLGSARSSKAEMASPVSGRKGVLKYGGFRLSCLNQFECNITLSRLGLTISAVRWWSTGPPSGAARRRGLRWSPPVRSQSARTLRSRPRNKRGIPCKRRFVLKLTMAKIASDQFCLRPCPALIFSKHAVGPHQTLEILSSCINSFFIDREHIA